MNPSRVLAPLAFLIALSLSAASASAAAQANLPTWTVGQAVGYGTNLNLTALAAPFIQAVRANPSIYNLTAVNKLTFTGSFDAWEYDQVTAKTDTYYVLSSQAATGLAFHLDANVTANNLPDPGTYAGSCSYGFFVPLSPIPTMARTVSAKVDWTSLGTSTGTTRYGVTDLATQRATANTTQQAQASVVAHGIPRESVNLTLCQETISYESASFTLTLNTQAQIRSLFNPALDTFNFPINDNETWWANTTSTVGATISGTINVQGLSTADQAAFFDNLTKALQSQPGLAVTGLNGFPIDLAKITITTGGTNVLQNGVLQDQTYPLNEELRARASAMSLSDSTIHNVYLLMPASYECPATTFGSSLETVASVYAPDFPAPNAGMVVGYEVYTCLGTTQMSVFELKNTPAADAKANVTKTESQYNPVPSTPSNAIVDFFAASPFYGIWIIVAVVVVAAALLVMRRRRRPAMATPPATPPQEPPAAPPPGGP